MIFGNCKLLEELGAEKGVQEMGRQVKGVREKRRRQRRKKKRQKYDKECQCIREETENIADKNF